MTITPQGLVYLCKTPLENDYKNQLTFANATAQYNYFYSKIQKTYSDYTYVKKDNVINVAENIDEIIDCNYLFYQNKGFTTKYYYCFIKNMEYVNENCTKITIETDCFQTWQFDINYKKCFVEREHVNDDTIGLHTIPEDLDTGEYICNDITTIDLGLQWYVMGATKQYDQNWIRGGNIYNGIYSGKTYYAFRTAGDLENVIDQYDQAGYGEDISELFIVPAKLIGNPTYDAQDPVYKVPASISSSDCGSASIVRPSTINGYTPRNKKLLVHPYQYLLADNNGGNSAEFRYELFNNPSSCNFKVMGALTPGTSMTLLPQQYLNSTGNSDPTLYTPNMINQCLTLAKFPACNWNTDLYTNWLTQNGVNMKWERVSTIAGGVVTGAGIGAKVGMAGGPVGGVIGAGIGALVGGTTGGIINTHNAMIQKHNQSFSPTQGSGNANSGDVITSLNANNPYFYKMSIKQEYAKIIDSFFDIFGYKVNEVKIPNITGRTNWNYIKTIDCNFDGNIPQVDLEIIKTMFNNGVTMWHNPTTMLDYSQSNAIVS